MCCNWLGKHKIRMVYSADSMSSYVVFDLGDISYTCFVPGLLQWPYRCVSLVLTSPREILICMIEGLIMACSFILLSGVYGPQIWQSPISELTGNDLFGELTIRDLWVPMVFATFLIAHLPSWYVVVTRIY